MARSKRRSDESFEDYLHHSRVSREAKKWARVHVEGFNAARSDLISVGSLIREGDAAEQIEGERIFRILNGYDSIPLALLRSIRDYGSVLRLSSIAERIRWKPGHPEVHFRSALSETRSVLKCRRLIVTVSLGVLQSAGIRFEPEPAKALNAARALKLGHVYRVTFRFRDAFWKEKKEFENAGFFVSQDKQFFTWWTAEPISAPLLTAWMAGSAADEFSPRDSAEVARNALESLHRILGRKIPQPQSFYFHDWKSDLLFRGAYSYVPKGARGAREALAKPVSKTLYFTGEAASGVFCPILDSVIPDAMLCARIAAFAAAPTTASSSGSIAILMIVSTTSSGS